MAQCMENLKDKVALVTGAGGGIARAVAIGLAEAGARVILVGRTPEKLEQTRKTIGERGGIAFPMAADVSKIEEVGDMARKVLEAYGAPSVLVNGAGVHGEIRPLGSSDPERWIQTLMINTAAPYLVCRAFMNEMVQLGWGRIINISSAASLSQPGGINSAYALSKAALNHFTRQLAAELDKTGVTANVLHPGEVKTDMWAAIRDDILASGADAMLRWVRWVEETGGDPPEKTVRLVLRLAGTESDGVNGRFLWIEDGLKKPMPSWD